MSIYAARNGDFVEHFCPDVSGLSGKFCDLCLPVCRRFAAGFAAGLVDFLDWLC